MKLAAHGDGDARWLYGGSTDRIQEMSAAITKEFNLDEEVETYMSPVAVYEGVESWGAEAKDWTPRRRPRAGAFFIRDETTDDTIEFVAKTWRGIEHYSDEKCEKCDRYYRFEGFRGVGPEWGSYICSGCGARVPGKPRTPEEEAPYTKQCPRVAACTLPGHYRPWTDLKPDGAEPYIWSKPLWAPSKSSSETRTDSSDDKWKPIVRKHKARDTPIHWGGPTCKSCKARTYVFSEHGYVCYRCGEPSPVGLAKYGEPSLPHPLDLKVVRTSDRVSRVLRSNYRRLWHGWLKYGGQIAPVGDGLTLKMLLRSKKAPPPRILEVSEDPALPYVKVLRDAHGSPSYREGGLGDPLPSSPVSTSTYLDSFRPYRDYWNKRRPLWNAARRGEIAAQEINWLIEAEEPPFDSHKAVVGYLASVLQLYNKRKRVQTTLGSYISALAENEARETSTEMGDMLFYQLASHVEEALRSDAESPYDWNDAARVARGLIKPVIRAIGDEARYLTGAGPDSIHRPVRGRTPYRPRNIFFSPLHQGHDPEADGVDILDIGGGPLSPANVDPTERGAELDPYKIFVVARAERQGAEELIRAAHAAARRKLKGKVWHVYEALYINEATRDLEHDADRAKLLFMDHKKFNVYKSRAHKAVAKELQRERLDRDSLNALRYFWLNGPAVPGRYGEPVCGVWYTDPPADVKKDWWVGLRGPRGHAPGCDISQHAALGKKAADSPCASAITRGTVTRSFKDLFLTEVYPTDWGMVLAKDMPGYPSEHIIERTEDGILLPWTPPPWKKLWKKAFFPKEPPEKKPFVARWTWQPGDRRPYRRWANQWVERSGVRSNPDKRSALASGLVRAALPESVVGEETKNRRSRISTWHGAVKGANKPKSGDPDNELCKLALAGRYFPKEPSQHEPQWAAGWYLKKYMRTA